MTDKSVKIEIDQKEAIELASTLIAVMLTTANKDNLKLAIKMVHQLVSQMANKDDALTLSMSLTMIELMGPVELKKLFENKMGKTQPEPKQYDQTKN